MPAYLVADIKSKTPMAVVQADSEADLYCVLDDEYAEPRTHFVFVMIGSRTKWDGFRSNWLWVAPEWKRFTNEHYEAVFGKD